MATPRADPTIDYYAELGLKDSATDDEINKAYRKLAFKYHPDRNHGREDEVQSKFQAISAAHDTLLDPDLRRKYDLGRKRGPGAGPSTFASSRPSRTPGSANPYKATADFAPPPRPPGFQQRPSEPRPTSEDSNASSGANRYTRGGWTQPGRAAPSMGSRPDPKAKANVFNAWKNMNPNGPKPPASRTYNVPRFDGSRHAADQESRPSSDSSGRSAFEEVNSSYRRPPASRPASARVPPRKGGFDPGSASNVDEPQAPSTSYNVPRYGRGNTSPMDPPPVVPPRPAPTARKPSYQASSEDVHYSEGSRERTPYFKSAGERTYVRDTGANIRRTASVRDATAMHPGMMPRDPRSGRHRSLSPRHRTSGGRPSSGDGPKPQHRPYHSVSSSKPFMVNTSSSPESELSSDDPSLDDDENNDNKPRQHAPHNQAPSAAERPKAVPGSSWSKRHEAGTPIGKGSSLEDETRDGSTTDRNHAPHFSSAPATGSAGGKMPSGFSADQWQETNWAQTWAQPSGPDRGFPANARRGRVPASRPTQRTVPQAVTVEDIDRHLEKGDLPEATARAAATGNGVHAAVSDPMDIDDDNDSAVPNGPASPPPVPLANTRPNISMADFRHVAPFAASTTGSGINDLNELSSTLPFESRASSQHPTRAPERSELPKPPVAPLHPNVNVNQRRQFEVYLLQMADYMGKWNRYNARMVAHFQDRCEQQMASERGASAGWVDDFLGVLGETGELQGWDSYLRGQREDRRWRSAWQEACERHAEAIEWHERTRAQIMKSGGFKA